MPLEFTTIKIFCSLKKSGQGIYYRKFLSFIPLSVKIILSQASEENPCR